MAADADVFVCFSPANSLVWGGVSSTSWTLISSSLEEEEEDPLLASARIRSSSLDSLSGGGVTWRDPAPSLQQQGRRKAPADSLASRPPNTACNMLDTSAPLPHSCPTPPLPPLPPLFILSEQLEGDVDCREVLLDQSLHLLLHLRGVDVLEDRSRDRAGHMTSM